MKLPTLDASHARLESLPRTLWLGTTVTACGTRDRRLDDVLRWKSALHRGELPPIEADFGDPDAASAIRRAVGELALPSMARGVDAAVEQVLRTMLWHMDRLIDRAAWQSREQAIVAMEAAFREEWIEQRTGWESIAALLLGLGDLAHLSWAELQGRLNTREWALAQALSAELARAPEIVALIQRLGRGMERPPFAAPRAQDHAQQAPHTAPAVARITRLPDAPGEMHGVKLGGKVSRMVGAEAAQFTHPVLHKLWRARLAESRLQVWDETADVLDHVHDPAGNARTPVHDDEAPRERGPMIVCVDTSGSMKGGPERLAKAVVLEAARTAHREGRGCHVIAFGGPEEVLEHTLSFTVAGLDALLGLMGQAFDGGTDVALPIERAIERVHHQGWQQADILVVSDGEFGITPKVLDSLDDARAALGLRVQGLLVGDRETMGLLEISDHIHWVRDWRRFDPHASTPSQFSPVHSQSLTALYFPNALSARVTGKHRHLAAPQGESRGLGSGLPGGPGQHRDT